MEKDKELKELKQKIKESNQKLSRYPFELNEGEELMTINFSSVDQKIQNYSIICKNIYPFSY